MVGVGWPAAGCEQASVRPEDPRAARRRAFIARCWYLRWAKRAELGRSHQKRKRVTLPGDGCAPQCDLGGLCTVSVCIKSSHHTLQLCYVICQLYLKKSGVGARCGIGQGKVWGTQTHLAPSALVSQTKQCCEPPLPRPPETSPHQGLYPSCDPTFL